MRPRAVAVSIQAGAAVLWIAAFAACRTAPAPDLDASPAPPRVGQGVLLRGIPFPARVRFELAPANPARTYYLSEKGADTGDGSASGPWRDPSAALRALSPGDRLIVRDGVFSGPLRIDGTCTAGTEAAPIQIVFEKGVLEAGGASPVLTVARPFWSIRGLKANLDTHGVTGVVVEGADARGILLDGARILGGTGLAVRVTAGASDITISNSFISRQGGGRSPAPQEASGIVVERGTNRIRILANLISDRPGGSIWIGAPPAASSESAPPADVDVVGNTLVENREPAVLVSGGARLRVAGNTILRSRGGPAPEGRGIVIEDATGVRLEENHFIDASVAVQVGHVENAGIGSPSPVDVLVSRNYFERRISSESAGVDVESGKNIRVCNNVFDELADVFAVFGTPPRTQSLIIANNLVLRPTGWALRIDDLSAVQVLDGNVFVPSGTALSAEVGGRPKDLARVLSGRRMARNRVVAGVRMIHKDLSRIEGLDTRDTGLPVDGLTFEGPAPDIGIWER